MTLEAVNGGHGRQRLQTRGDPRHTWPADHRLRVVEIQQMVRSDLPGSIQRFREQSVTRVVDDEIDHISGELPARECREDAGAG